MPASLRRRSSRAGSRHPRAGSAARRTDAVFELATEILAYRITYRVTSDDFRSGSASGRRFGAAPRLVPATARGPGPADLNLSRLSRISVATRSLRFGVDAGIDIKIH